MKNTIIYIDGQNFLYKVSERLIAANLISDKQDIHSINIRELLEPLFPNHNLEIRYYGVKKISSGRSRDEGIQEKSKHFADSLRRLKNYLKKNGVKYIGKGSLKVRINEPCKKCGFVEYHFQEKGVDVGIAIDIVRDALLRKNDEIAVLSSDTDLVPALQVVKGNGMKVSYISFSGQATTSLVKLANKHFVLKDADICKAYIDSINE